MMLELDILPTGEIKGDGAYVGRIEWTAPMADALGGGCWIREGGDPTSRATISDLEDDIDELQGQLSAIKKALTADASDDKRITSALEIIEG